MVSVDMWLFDGHRAYMLRVATLPHRRGPGTVERSRVETLHFTTLRIPWQLVPMAGAGHCPQLPVANLTNDDVMHPPITEWTLAVHACAPCTWPSLSW